MKDNEKSNDKIYIVLKNEIMSVEGKYIQLKNLLSAVEIANSDMPVFLQSPEGQAAFLNAVTMLISEQLISPVGNKPYTYSGLYLKYKVQKDETKKDNELATQIIRSIELPAMVDYYIKHPQDFLHDKSIIETISSFLKRQGTDIVTVNERAYELFGDEKFFKGDERSRSRGEVVLKRLGLDYSHLGCIDTVEPFFSFYKKDFFTRNTRNICIIENKDTFWSFKRNVLDSASTLNVDMLIYGEGKKINSSFRFVEEYHVDAKRDSFFYFGDLDAEGINIYYDLKEQYHNFNILPLYEAYLATLEIGLKRGLAKTPKKQKMNEDNICKFVQCFNEPWTSEIKRILEEGNYIPQEALAATDIKERFGK
ncbi:MAG: DUF2220 domain-containing protein [Clostridia bacterium]|nr:DUF2220 domain-containing protein [Clostridia bacterium]